MSRGKPVTYYGAPSIDVIQEREGHQFRPVKYSRVWSMPNHQTFLIPPIAELVKRYVGDGKGWADPFAGDNSPAEFTNDHNPATRAKHHLEAREWSRDYLKKKVLEGVLFDPPYSFRQVSEHYKVLGQKATKLDTSMAFYEKVKSELCSKVDLGGYAISFGWNSNGFGQARGFRVVEIMQVAHGGSKNDTIVTVEIKTTPL